VETHFRIKPEGRQVELLVRPKQENEHATPKQDAINGLKSLQQNGEGSNVHANAQTVLCDFLDAVGYGEVAREFRKVHEMYPVVTPRYSKPSWRSLVEDTRPASKDSSR
jgi:hypothetical protein